MHPSAVSGGPVVLPCRSRGPNKAENRSSLSGPALPHSLSCRRECLYLSVSPSPSPSPICLSGCLEGADSAAHFRACHGLLAALPLRLAGAPRQAPVPHRATLTKTSTPHRAMLAKTFDACQRQGPDIYDKGICHSHITPAQCAVPPLTHTHTHTPLTDTEREIHTHSHTHTKAEMQLK